MVRLYKTKTNWFGSSLIDSYFSVKAVGADEPGAGELLSPLALPLVRAFLLLSFPFRAALEGFYNRCRWYNRWYAAADGRRYCSWRW
jgi:hypothetical protein